MYLPLLSNRSHIVLPYSIMLFRNNASNRKYIGTGNEMMVF